MRKYMLFSRRPDAAVDFRPEKEPGSPSYQVRRLSEYLEQEILGPDDITNCPDALDALLEYTYRKIFTGVSHDEYVNTDPKVVAWLCAVHEVESSHFQTQRSEKRNR